LYTLSLTSSLHSRRFLHVSGNSCWTSYLPFMISFNWCDIVLAFKLIRDWTFDSTCLVGVRSLSELLLSWSQNLHLRLEFTLYNMYVDLDKPMILYHVISHMFISWIMMNFHCCMSPLTCNLLGISMPYTLRFSKDKSQNSFINNLIFSQGKCW